MFDPLVINEYDDFGEPPRPIGLLALRAISAAVVMAVLILIAALAVSHHEVAQTTACRHVPIYVTGGTAPYRYCCASGVFEA